MSKIIQLIRFLGNMVANLHKKALLNFVVPLNKNVLPKLPTKVAFSLIDKFESKIIW